MRGRTLSDAFIIMDEAQNTTTEQMKMFVTRLGNNSKAVITGDLTQTDLPNPKKSGLLEALKVLDGVEGIRFCHFEDVDVVRHHLVQRIVRAYDTYGRAQQQLPLGLADAVLGEPPALTPINIPVAKPHSPELKALSSQLETTSCKLRASELSGRDPCPNPSLQYTRAVPRDLRHRLR